MVHTIYNESEVSLLGSAGYYEKLDPNPFSAVLLHATVDKGLQTESISAVKEHSPLSANLNPRPEM